MVIPSLYPSQMTNCHIRVSSVALLVGSLLPGFSIWTAAAAVKPSPIQIPTGSNLALKRPVVMSSTYPGGEGYRCVDGGKTNLNFNHGSCCHTYGGSAEKWVRVELDSLTKVNMVRVWNRGDCCHTRLNGFSVYVGSNPSSSITSNHNCGNGGITNPGAGAILTMDCGGATGKYVWIWLPASGPLINICEIEVYGEEMRRVNLALERPVTQDSVYQTFGGSGCVNGNTATVFGRDGNCCHTAGGNLPGPRWVRVELAAARKIGFVYVYNRGDCCGSRLKNWAIWVGSNTGSITANYNCGNGGVSQASNGQVIQVYCNGALGKYVWLRTDHGATANHNPINVCEIEVYEATEVEEPKLAVQSCNSHPYKSPCF